MVLINSNAVDFSLNDSSTFSVKTFDAKSFTFKIQDHSFSFFTEQQIFYGFVDIGRGLHKAFIHDNETTEKVSRLFRRQRCLWKTRVKIYDDKKMVSQESFLTKCFPINMK